jgi:MFS family permease
MMQESSGLTTEEELPWYKEITATQIKVFIAAFLGYGLDYFDLMAFNYVMVYLIEEFQLTNSVIGVIASAALVTSAFGGLFFGYLADKTGRKKAMFWTILTYSLATAACGFAQNMIQLFIFRIIVGFGFGGQWGIGTAYVAETWPAKYRAKALGLLQLSSTCGSLLVTWAAAFIVPQFGWRTLFIVGAIPALLSIFVMLFLPESKAWAAREKRLSFGEVLKSTFGTYTKQSIGALILLSIGMLGFWAMFSWLPTYLATPLNHGGRGFTVIKTSLAMGNLIIGSVFGVSAFGFIASKIGPSKTFVLYFIGSAVCLPVYLFISSDLLVYWAFIFGFFTSYYAGYTVILAPMFPPDIRATAQGVVYNLARILSGFAPFIVGSLAAVYGLHGAFFIATGIFALGAVFAVIVLPFCKGTQEI